MNKLCKNYGTSWCQDFECPDCPVRTFEFDSRIKKKPGYDPGAKTRKPDPGTIKRDGKADLIDVLKAGGYKVHEVKSTTVEGALKELEDFAKEND